jgi:hypothetical protein
VCGWFLIGASAALAGVEPVCNEDAKHLAILFMSSGTSLTSSRGQALQETGRASLCIMAEMEAFIVHFNRDEFDYMYWEIFRPNPPLAEQAKVDTMYIVHELGFPWYWEVSEVS